MARVTVEDCVTRVPNRFELVMLAAQRSRNLSAGVQPRVDRDNDKNPVVALREIADGVIVLEDVRQGLLHGLQRHAETDEPEEEEMTMGDVQHLGGRPEESVFSPVESVESVEEAEGDVEEEAREDELDTGLTPDALEEDLKSEGGA